jgi:hypothetical protein
LTSLINNDIGGYLGGLIIAGLIIAGLIGLKVFIIICIRVYIGTRVYIG